MIPKIIAFYLPQFHSIPENDKWWGRGFTEWTNTSKSKPLYKGHYQPREPLNDNYYNLLDSNTQEWQAKVAKQNGIYGFCYYHYWFNGKMLIEKPMENMLKNKNIKIPFCISWANEPWTRNWDGRNREVLMHQFYGDRLEWEEHFQYLINFFEDDRYILKDNKPVFLLYRTNSIDNCEKMVEYWNQRCKDYGFDGIYIVETLTGHQKSSHIKNSSAVAEMEPMHTIRHGLPILTQGKRYIIKKLNKYMNIHDRISYIKTWDCILKKHRSYNDKKVFLGGFVDWDNSARWGKRAMIMEGANPKLFSEYFKKQFEIAKQIKSDFIFFNAWNEWAEGTYLEPDKKYEYNYLKEIKKITNNTNN
ncbi:glycoside hydrolase family 99-like domain-containing protein [Paraclostridium sordellii]|uniref:glycosyltransferase WbsX family protein n=1 Tax=Paraclostridium sordellii TaxID=1505 RepID=UPI0030CF3D49